MNLYEKRNTLNFVLMFLAALIVAASLIYTNILATNLGEQERNKVALWANAYKNLNQADENTDIGFLFDVIKNNETVPVILADEAGDIKAWRNLDSIKAERDPEYLTRQLKNMKEDRPPIVVEVGPDEKNYIYYKDSFPLVQLRYFPFVQLGVIALFILIGYVTVMTTRSAEQNRVWVGMAKETAHQLGTPISSLMAWVEYLKESGDKPIKPQVTEEIEKDVNRLELVADRFSKIGSKPSLDPLDLNALLLRSMNYVKDRASGKVSFQLNEKAQVSADMNAPLFEWVMENLLKNALDAMEGAGQLTITLSQQEGNAIVDVTDTGKGIPRSKFNTVFQPGFSTKKRGWGLGLALTKRIVEQYHGGKIVVKDSTEGKGTTFRITIPVAK